MFVIIMVLSLSTDKDFKINLFLLVKLRKEHNIFNCELKRGGKKFEPNPW